ncbi:uncharacterized protein C5orf34 homolog isoform X2 [Antennarius striatus]|uniref:uncharacterized protein C5orf34 homolog isoform X2 n=1 Tax=Antennarius striatus TaxID=241820 RepID=UPI0035B4787D
MMDTGAGLMLLYEDESVDVRYGTGARLQLSPCGSEFLLEAPTGPPGHPRERVRQRTRFTVSAYKDQVLSALAFRNRHAARPYLPEELVPPHQNQPSLCLDPEVVWPGGWSCDAQTGPGGETTVKAEGGRAELTLSPSGEEFSVRFTCGLSRQQPEGGPRRCTTVTQVHSCCAVSPPWSYPLSLALRLRGAPPSEPGAVPTEGSPGTSTPSPERWSRLPEPLPLTCPSPHRHRWRGEDLPPREEQSPPDVPSELVRVMWCHGATYRALGGACRPVGGAVPVVEVSPGDGSLIRSDGVDSYFIHHKAGGKGSAQVKEEVTYHLKNLPPDRPGQLFSVSTAVSRASRLLSCYLGAQRSLNLSANPSCLQEVGSSCESPPPEASGSPEQRSRVQQTNHRSGVVAAELEKIRRFTFLLENNHLLRGGEPAGAGIGPAGGPEVPEEDFIADVLQRTSRTIQDIDALLSAASLT